MLLTSVIGKLLVSIVGVVFLLVLLTQGTITVAHAASTYNNAGISSDSNTRAANYDNSGASYSSNALSAAGFNAGAPVTLNGITFQWPAAAPGTPDNWRSAGQVLPLTAASGTILGFLGSAANGAASGAATVTYTDGSTKTFTLAFSDWTLGAGHASISSSGSIAATMPYRNVPSGRQTVTTYVFYTSVSLNPGKTVRSVTLPGTVSGGQLHVFAIAVGTPNATQMYNNPGISSDAAPNFSNYDGGGYSYSNNALRAAGFASGTSVTVNGIAFAWPTVNTGTADNWQSVGQVLPVAASSGTVLGLLGSATNGVASGTATITYTDNSTQSFTLAFSDWTLGAGHSSVLSGDRIAVQLPYRNASGGRQSVTTYIFYTAVSLAAGKTVKSLTMPSATSGGQLHVFAIGIGVPSATSIYNNEGISNDSNTQAANFDGRGGSYSNNALNAVGFTSGTTVTTNGIAFQWPTVSAGAADNWQSAGQTLPLPATSGTTLGLLGSASNGAASGTATITYSDGSTQSFTLAFSDWTLGGGGTAILPGDSIAAQLPYRNVPSGRQTVTTYVFYTAVSLDSSKIPHSLTLPGSVSGGQLHVFAFGIRSSDAKAPSDWTTYLANNAHTGFNGAETTLSVSTVPHLSSKWIAHGAGGISVQPIEANGSIYWGSWDGLMHATDLSGKDIWQTNIGQTTDQQCVPPTVGVASTAALGSIGTTPVAFVGGGNATFYALNATTGAVLWSTSLGASPAHFIWSSPALYNGSVYIGLASFGDCPLVQGQVIQLDAATGAIQHVFNTVPNGCVGGGVSGSPTIDEATGILYVATGNPDSSCPTRETYGSAVIALHTSDLSLIGSWQTPDAFTGDFDFVNTPTLFTTTINGARVNMVGVANKNGFYYAFDRSNVAAGPKWQAAIATGGDCPQCGSGSISPSAWDGKTLYAAGGSTIINGQSCKGSIRALNPATGGYFWQVCLSAPVLGAVSVIPGVVVIDEGNTLMALSASSGGTLFTYTDTGSYSTFYSAPTIANGRLYAANLDGNFFAFGL